MATEIKQDHNIASATGAVAGAMAGGALGSIAGPVGTIAGAALGAVAGAKAGDTAAEIANPTDYDAYFQDKYQQRPYYASSYGWNDYQPAYRYGRTTQGMFAGRRFEDVEAELANGWERAKDASRLAWVDAREAVRDGWHTIERAMPGDFDRDGR